MMRLTLVMVGLSHYMGVVFTSSYPLHPPYSDTDYLFGHYCGILLASTFYLVVYSAVRRNRPRVYPQVVIPGLISGVMWGIAMGQ